MFRKDKGFHSSLNFSSKKVKKILTKKIHQEKAEIKENSSDKNKAAEQKLRDSLVKNRPNNSKRIKIDSLFSGAGGLDLGVEMAGVSAKYGVKSAYNAIKNLSKFSKLQNISDIIYSNDLFTESNDTYSNNFKHFNHYFIKDTRDIKKVINFPNCDLMLGGFPCPGFSVAGPRLIDDPRNFLYINYVRALMNAKPKFFIGENVKGLTTMAKGKVLRQIAEDFSSAGYRVDVNLVNARDYGVPQSRERVFIVGTRNDIANNYHYMYKKPTPTNGPGLRPYVTLKTALDGLPKIPKKPDDYFRGGYSSIYMSRNRRRSWNQQSFTIQASGRQAPQYPGGVPMEKLGKDHWQFQQKNNKDGWHRRLSAREEARIQCFPDWFTFTRGRNTNRSKNSRLGVIYKQIGNAVPVFLAEHMARPIMKFLIDHPNINNKKSIQHYKSTNNPTKSKQFMQTSLFK